MSILAGVLGKPLRSVDIPVETAVENLVRAAVPAQMATAVGEFEVWARKHAARFV